MLRSTLRNFPNKKALLEESNLPLAFFCQPFSDQPEAEVCELWGTPSQCSKCHAFINKSANASRDSFTWTCVFCQNKNEITTTSGEELKRDSYEFPTRVPVTCRPVHVFVLDAGLKGNFLTEVCDAISAELDSYSTGVDIAFLTYDNRTIQLYRHRNDSPDGLKREDFSELATHDESYYVKRKNYLIGVSHNKAVIRELLAKFRTGRHFERRAESSALGPAVLMAYSLAKYNGGRITIFHESGKIPDVEPGSLMTAEPERNRFYRELGERCHIHNVIVDLFLLGWEEKSCYQRLFDLARHSGGCTRFYYNPEHLRQPLRRFLRGPIAWQVKTEISLQKGIKYRYGFGSGNSWKRLTLPVFHPDDSFSFAVEIEGELYEDVQFQLVQRYQKSDGQCMIRVHNISLPVKKALSELYESLDPTVMMAYLAKVAADEFMHGRYLTPAIIRGKIIDKCNYIKSGKGEWNTDEFTRLTASLLLSVPFQPRDLFSASQCASIIDKWKSLPFNQLTKYVVPEGYVIGDDGGLVPLDSSSSRLRQDKIQVFDAGDVLYFIVGKDTNEIMVRGLFGVDFARLNADDLPMSTSSLKKLMSTPRVIQVIKEDSLLTCLFPSILPARATEVTRFTELFLSSRSQLTSFTGGAPVVRPFSEFA